jgi:N-methylhydantoinase B
MTLDEVAGGGGARSFKDGADSSGPTTSPGGGTANIEVNESYLPVRYLVRRELADSGGPGRFRGGVGSLHVLTPHRVSTPVGVISFGQGLQHPGAGGLAGGAPGGSGAFAIVALDEVASVVAGGGLPVLPIPTPDVQLTAELAHVAVSQGGGGFGDPLDRDPAAVESDVRDGLVSAAGALRDYGVVVSALDGGIDGAATTEQRASIRRTRLGGATASPASGEPIGRRLSVALSLVGSGEDTRVACSRCGGDICAAGANLYEHLVLEERPVTTAAPLGLRYEGSDRFVMRHFYCPSCAAQLEVLVALRGDPLLRAIEPIV